MAIQANPVSATRPVATACLMVWKRVSLSLVLLLVVASSDQSERSRIYANTLLARFTYNLPSKVAPTGIPIKSTGAATEAAVPTEHREATARSASVRTTPHPMDKTANQANPEVEVAAVEVEEAETTVCVRATAEQVLEEELEGAEANRVRAGRRAEVRSRFICGIRT
jgi:hypothetical protein